MRHLITSVLFIILFAGCAGFKSQSQKTVAPPPTEEEINDQLDQKALKKILKSRDLQEKLLWTATCLLRNNDDGDYLVHMITNHNDDGTSGYSFIVHSRNFPCRDCINE